MEKNIWVKNFYVECEDFRKHFRETDNVVWNKEDTLAIIIMMIFIILFFLIVISAKQ